MSKATTEAFDIIRDLEKLHEAALLGAGEDGTNSEQRPQIVVKPTKEQRSAGILSDDEIMGFWETNAIPEDGGIYNISCVAKEIVEADANVIEKLKSSEARALFFMREFFLLGVLRGAETYRAIGHTGDADLCDIPDLPFRPLKLCSLDLVEELNENNAETAALARILGLASKWTAEKAKKELDDFSKAYDPLCDM